MKESGKERQYRVIQETLAELLEGCPDLLAAMATAAALLKARLPYVFWVGFYLPDEDGSLKVGPYQGPVACLRLAPGRGVCGEAAAARRTVVVPDVGAHRDHIACDPRSKSEIVVPVLDGERLVAVLDLDSDRLDAFSDLDKAQLESIARRLVAR